MSDPFVILDEDRTIKHKQVRDYDDRGFDGGFLLGFGARSESLQVLVSKRKIFWLAVVIFLSIAVLLARTFYLQVGRGSYYRNIAEGNRIRLKPIRANRGVIWDREGELLVRNGPRFSLYFIPADLPKGDKERQEVLIELSKILNKPFLEIKKLVDESWQFSYEPVLIKEDIPYEQAIILKIESSKLGGIFLDTLARRDYLDTGFSLAHILGYTSKLTEEEYGELKESDYLIDDYLGRTGLERIYEKELRGRYGKKKVEVDFLGKEEDILSSLPSLRGQDLLLSIDLDWQERTTSVLKDYLGKFGLTKGVVIISEVNSGQILTLVSLPAYDNNLFSWGILEEDYSQLLEDRDKPLFNRAIAGEYPPGSTFKLAELAGALEEGIVKKETAIFSAGGIRVGEWFFPDWKVGGHGRVDAVKAIAESVNTYFYYLGGGYEDFSGLGVERINHWAYLFGMGQELGIDLLGEEDGFLPTKQWKLKYKKESWYIGDTYHLAIGQGDVLVTPLQVLSFTAAVANGGTLYQPRLVAGLMDGETKEKSFLAPEIVRTGFVRDENLAVIREGMRDSVIYGSSRGLYYLPVEVAGKTGTAQVGGEEKAHAWFTGFAPYENPEIAITILVENGEEGSRVAVPIAREILTYYFERRE